ncbi:MAG TPA: PASTA domain-containing protein [Candidatus Egerieicola pullicola]|uniref:PASTA domain-containing protein n=1 Tax=Candidatus Egerieicola pullicola TaxID=2840775 RepID=A0A9D1AIP1_9FIRM|nr:PASTA domain-containing protein [Candidatus Egerieicola pullicola]
MKEAMNRRMKRRLNVIVPVALALVLVWVLYNLGKTVSDPFYREYANAQQLSEDTIPADRGTIYDTNGEVLAESYTVWTVQLSPVTIDAEDKEMVAQFLAETLELDYETVLKQCQQTNRYAVVKKQVEKPEADKIREFAQENGITAIALIEDTKRYYPNNDLASHVIGYVGSDNQGLGGIELEYDDILTGTPGKIVSAADANGNAIATTYESEYAPVDGQSLVLTIDSQIQYYVEKALDQAVADRNPSGGACAIVMNVNNGEILAMASYPDYNPNDPFTLYTSTQQAKLNQPVSEGSTTTYTNSDLLYQQWNNKCTSWTYQPGSVFKIFTGSSALEEGVIDMNTTFSCSGSMQVADRTFRCHLAAGHGVQTLLDAYVNSCNPAFIQIGQALGVHKFSEYYELYGFTEKTGIDLPGEEGGSSNLYIPEADMGPVELASSSFGQTTMVTPIQMATAISAAVNGGYLYQPHVVKEVLDQNGNVVQSYDATLKRQVISEEVSAELRECLEAMVSANGGSTAYIEGYRIGGKSGTSQKNNQDGHYVGSFAAFAPADDPEIVAMVVVDDPDLTLGSYYGSAVAGPALQSIMGDTLSYLGYSKEFTAEQIAAMEKTAPSLTGKDIETATADAAASDFEVRVIGSGDTVLDQMPRNGTAMAEGSTILLYTDDTVATTCTVPNVVGMRPSDANYALTAAGLNVSYNEGVGGTPQSTAVVTSQNYPEGTQLPAGSVVNINFSTITRDG